MFYPDNSACVSTSTGIIRKNCQHCPCRYDTAGNLHCCKCGLIIKSTWAFYPDPEGPYLISVPPGPTYTLPTNLLGEVQDE